jgi:ribosomal protein S18 acetylase RimI-like enzyme
MIKVSDLLTTASDHEIRTLTERDLQEVAGIHVAAFPDSVLTKLGRESTRRYYEWQLIGPHDAVALGVFCDNNLAGFCFGGVFRGAMSGFLHRNKVFLLVRVITHPWLAMNPVFLDRLNLSMSILKPRRSAEIRKQAPSLKGETIRPFGILSIAVHPRRQGLGVGKMLMVKCEAIAGLRGFHQMGLTVHPANHEAVRFYERLGWERVITVSTWTGSMRKHLESEAHG